MLAGLWQPMLGKREIYQRQMQTLSGFKPHKWQWQTLTLSVCKTECFVCTGQPQAFTRNIMCSKVGERQQNDFLIIDFWSSLYMCLSIQPDTY